ncbi:DUF3225 domain-containing protein [Halostella sp. JP-L12]|uniref:nuclear transport factor 2 family protein n=1 Tax=Halostella TaxID=1843185 RepID=UPI000EF80BD8|nr:MULTISPECIES: nuclear transport factor 2 family protein [Halostella]NHN48659.1 DUF3225 domain-containing protein [Halostella sp. JP-L12]
MTAADTVREYYESLRRGEPLYTYFAEDAQTTKFGIAESLVGYDDVAEGLREQSRTTEEWTVDTRRLSVTERDDFAWFSDEVDLAWTDATTGQRRAYATRWSGALERRDGEWLFVELHVSAPDRTLANAGNGDGD